MALDTSGIGQDCTREDSGGVGDRKSRRVGEAEEIAWPMEGSPFKEETLVLFKDLEYLRRTKRSE